ncbi:MAG: RsmD family RNA methyltransferase [Sulfurovaceae bacterium]
MKQKSVYRTKIIAGTFKGIMLDVPKVDTTRASKAILKESIFNTLQFKIIDKPFFEVFGGSGSVGLEALSRGVERVYSELKSLNKKCYIYLDPPFSIREGMDDIYEKTMILIASIEQEVCDMVMLEHMSSLVIPESIGAFELARSKKFGRTTISYYVPKEIA